MVSTGGGAEPICWRGDKTKVNIKLSIIVIA